MSCEEEPSQIEPETRVSIFQEASWVTTEYFNRRLRTNYLCAEQVMEEREYSPAQAESLVRQAWQMGINTQEFEEEVFDPEEEITPGERWRCLAGFAIPEFIRRSNPVYNQEEERRSRILKQRLKQVGFAVGKKVSKPEFWFNYHFRLPLVLYYWKFLNFLGLLEENI